MKIDRLLGIVIYLLNHDLVNANTLAEKFEVSSRTIQRDIETLNLAGIPVTSIYGTNGGYGIMDGFKLQKQIATSEDYRFTITALKGLCSAYDNRKLEETIEKVINCYNLDKYTSSKLRLNFSVSKEGININKYIKLIEEATDEERIIEFEYTNSYGDNKVRLVEPVGIIYKWYAWYILAYCCNKKDYRMFKVVRMRNLKKLEDPFSIKHENIDKLLEQQEKQDSRKYMDVTILCRKETRISIEEYFPNGTIKELEGGDFLLQLNVPNNEIGWKGLLFTYGNKIKIIEPQQLEEEFILKANEIINTYK